MAFNPNFPSSSLCGHPPYLSEFSEEYRDSRYGILKTDSLQASKLLGLGYKKFGYSKLKKWSERIARCSPSLYFLPTSEGIKLREASFCKVRVCPLCTSRRSKILQSKYLQVWPQILNHFPEQRYLFLTLTIRNVHVTNLRQVVKKLLVPSSQRFFDNVGYRLKSTLKGYIRKFECTQSKKNLDYSHPHLHYLIAVDKNYFEDFYLKFDTWQLLWKDALRANYKPFLNIKAVDRDNEKGVLEVLKYELKPNDFKNDYIWFSEYALQVSGFQSISVSGVFRKYASFLEYDPDFIHGADIQKNRKFGISENLIPFYYNQNAKQYCIGG